MLGVSVDSILYDYSWANLLLYSASLPQYDDEKEENEFDEKLDACNPANFGKWSDEDEYI